MKYKNNFCGLQMRAYATLIGMLFASAIYAEDLPSGEVVASGSGVASAVATTPDAASAVPAAAAAVPETVASAGGAGQLVESCVACHGTNGNNTEADVPNIASYSAFYLTGSLKKFKDKIRPCVETEIRSGDKKGSKTDMCQIAAGLSDSDITQLGDYFAAQTFVPAPQTFDAELAKKGKVIQDKKCSTCHDKDGALPGDNAGILAGQKMDYLRQQVKFFKEGKRPMHKRMKPKLEALDESDVEAVVNFFASKV
jgi:sulfide dehydrogenase cytochrome subunit